jgi:hypothetical protein
MSYKASEDSVRKALDGMDLELYAYKPPDNPGPRQNWKPCDFMVWFDDGINLDGEAVRGSVWLEVKDHQGVKSVATAHWRPTQIAGMRIAAELAIPYLAVVRWSKLRLWTIGLAALVLAAVDAQQTSIPLAAWPIQCVPNQLASHLRAALIEGL